MATPIAAAIDEKAAVFAGYSQLLNKADFRSKAEIVVA